MSYTVTLSDGPIYAVRVVADPSQIIFGNVVTVTQGVVSDTSEATLNSTALMQPQRNASPGRAPVAWTGNISDLAALGGNPAFLPDITTLSGISIVGSRIRATNANRNIVMKDPIPVAAGRRLAVDFVAERIVNSTSGNVVGFGISFLAADLTEITPRSFLSEVLTTSQGVVTRRRVVSDTLADGVNAAWPAGTAYIVPFFRLAGTDHTTDAISISIQDVTHPASSPASSAVSVSGNLVVWTRPAATTLERVASLNGGPPVLIPSNGLIFLHLTYGDSTASNRAATWQDRVPQRFVEFLSPLAVMLETQHAPGFVESTASPTITGLVPFDDRLQRRTSNAALGQTELVGTAYRYVTQGRDRRLPPTLRGFAACGIAGYQLEDVMKGSTTEAVDTYQRLMNIVDAWIAQAALYGLTVRVATVHVSIGSNDTAARYAGTVAAYATDLQTLFTNLQNDLQAKTGQPAVPMILFGTTASTVEALKPSLALAQLADTYRASTTIVPLGPEYCWPFASPNHHDVDAVIVMGEKLAHYAILGGGANAPRVLYPSGAVWSTNTCTITIADCTQLVIDTDSLPAHPDGFLGIHASNTGGAVITGVSISGTADIVVTFDTTPASGTVITYAQGVHTDPAQATDVTGISRGYGNIRNEQTSATTPSEIYPAWERSNSAVTFNRVFNGRPVLFHDWLHNFEVVKP